MNRTSFLVVGAFLFVGQLAAQTSNYDWAVALSKEFGFDDIAEKIFQDLSSGGKTQIEKLQGKLGLADLKARQGQKAATLVERLKILDDSRQLMQAVKDEWPEKNSEEYQKAVFSFVEVLKLRGEMAMATVTSGKADGNPLPEADADKLRQSANADYGRAEAELDKIMSGIGEVAPEDNKDKWRLRNRAWYTLLQLKYNKAMTAKKGSTQAMYTLTEMKNALEDFILSNDLEDYEAQLGCLYGYLLKGQVHQALGEGKDAEDAFASPINQILWETKLDPTTQGVAEYSYYLLFQHLNDAKRYDATMKYGQEMAERYKKLGMTPTVRGRAALVEVAEARLRLGDMNGALGLAAGVIEDAKDDVSGKLANQLVAEIIAATTDKTQFSPEIIRSAAKGAMAGGPTKRSDAVAYFQILLQVLPKVADEAERKYWGAEAWYMTGSAHYLNERYLEAAMAFEQGARQYKDVDKDDLSQNLVKFWDKSLELCIQQGGNVQELKDRLKSCRDWQLQNSVGTKSKGEILVSQAKEAERLAAELDKAKNFADALKKYDEAVALYAEAVKEGGPKREQAMITGARVGIKVARVLVRQGENAEALKRMEAAKKQFKDYLAFIADPANRLTDPDAMRGRESARAQSRYNIADINDDLAKDLKDEAKKKDLYAESVALLAGFETEHASETDLRVFAVATRAQARIAVGDLAGAEADYAWMTANAAEHDLTSRTALAVGQAVKKEAQPALDAVVGKVKPLDHEWAAVTAKPQYEAVKNRWLHVCGLYRSWLYGARSPTFANYDTVAAMYGQVGSWPEVAEIVQKALEKFANTSSVKGDDMIKMQSRGLQAFVELAKAADARDDGDTAGRLWNDAGRAIDTLMKDPKLARSPSIVRTAAIVYGGYIARKDGVPRYYNALGRHDEAVKLWVKLEKAAADPENISAESLSLWWEAKFHGYYGAMRIRRDQKADLKDVRAAYESLKAAKPELGGPQWKPYFEWLERELR